MLYNIIGILKNHNQETVSGGKFMNTTQHKKTSYTPHKKQNQDVSEREWKSIYNSGKKSYLKYA